jgi:hypothetical protein
MLSPDVELKDIEKLNNWEQFKPQQHLKTPNNIQKPT